LRAALAWVLGRGGLLGSRTEALLPRELVDADCWIPAQSRFSWHDAARLARELDDAAEAFAAEVRRRDACWLMLWCAGAGGIGTLGEALQQETAALRRLIDRLSSNLAEPEPARHGLIMLSSSAGGVYGDNPDIPLTESSRCSPISEYGTNKLAQEEFVLRWAEERPNVSCLIARFSNLYGLEQKLGRPQGLIAQLSRSIVRHEPVHIYVPLDTLRDYVFVDDAARQVLRALAQLRQAAPGRRVVKIFAAGQSISIAGIIGIFSRVAKRPPRIVCMPHARHRQQPLRLQFRSEEMLDEAYPPATDLAAGIHAMLHHHVALYQQGRLPVR
jgi:UDP-glucose 4-epimerase